MRAWLVWSSTRGRRTRTPASWPRWASESVAASARSSAWSFRPTSPRPDLLIVEQAHLSGRRAQKDVIAGGQEFAGRQRVDERREHAFRGRLALVLVHEQAGHGTRRSDHLDDLELRAIAPRIRHRHALASVDAKRVTHPIADHERHGIL